MIIVYITTPINSSYRLMIFQSFFISFQQSTFYQSFSSFQMHFSSILNRFPQDHMSFVSVSSGHLQRSSFFAVTAFDVGNKSKFGFKKSKRCCKWRITLRSSVFFKNPQESNTFCHKISAFKTYLVMIISTSHSNLHQKHQMQNARFQKSWTMHQSVNSKVEEEITGAYRLGLAVIFKNGFDLYNLFIAKEKSPMQALPNEYPLLSFVVFPCNNHYFAFTPVAAGSSSQGPSTPTKIQTSYYYSSKTDPFILSQECFQGNIDSSTNLQQNREMSETENQSHIEAPLMERSEPQPYSPVVLAFNGDSTSILPKPEDIQIKNVPSNKKLAGKEVKGKGKKMDVEEDREYNPQAERRKKTASKYQENQNRNIIPNQINQIFSFLQKKGKSGVIAQKLFEKFPHPSEYNLKRYYLYQSLLKNKLGHYTNEKSLRLVTELYEPKCENWPEHEQRFYNKISRILIRHFLHEDSIFMILTSKRMKSEKKADHIRARRHVKEAVLRILKGC